MNNAKHKDARNEITVLLNPEEAAKHGLTTEQVTARLLLAGYNNVTVTTLTSCYGMRLDPFFQGLDKVNQAVIGGDIAMIVTEYGTWFNTYGKWHDKPALAA